MSDLLEQRFSIIINVARRFLKEEIKYECETELNTILNTTKISVYCMTLMVESISRYISQPPELVDPEHKRALEKDLEIINRLLAQKKSAKAIFERSDLKAQGISDCTILTGLQKLWVKNYIKYVNDLRGFEKSYKGTADYKRYGLIPGQHLFYYGAFTGTVTGFYSPATHHFVYIGKGLIVEVGTDLIPGCLDIHEKTTEKPKSLKERIFEKPGYKKAMSYFGISTLQSAVRWAQSYGQTDFFLYRFPNDNSLDVIMKRLERASELIGKWKYSLLRVSNNCENAATYISHGTSLSSQACFSDMFVNSLQSVMTQIPFMTARQRRRVQSGFLSPFTFEHELKFSTDIPRCDKNDSFANRYISKKNYVCKGLPITVVTPDSSAFDQSQQVERYCNVDRDTCTTCAEGFTDDVDLDARSQKICKVRGKANNYKLLD